MIRSDGQLPGREMGKFRGRKEMVRVSQMVVGKDLLEGAIWIRSKTKFPGGKYFRLGQYTESTKILA